jgi:hypothetical protein
VDPLTLLAAANAAVAAVRKGCELYREIKGVAGEAKDVLDDLKSQFQKIPNPTNEQKQKYNEEVRRVQEVAKADPNDTISQIGDQLGVFFDAYDSIEQQFWQEETAATQVYKGEESLSRRALKRVLIRSRLDQMQAEIREMMVYRTPPDLKDLWSRFEKMRERILKEQAEAKAEELKQLKIAAFKRRRMIEEMREYAAWAGAVVFVILWMIGVLLLVRTSHTYHLQS